MLKVKRDIHGATDVQFNVNQPIFRNDFVTKSRNFCEWSIVWIWSSSKNGFMTDKLQIQLCIVPHAICPLLFHFVSAIVWLYPARFRTGSSPLYGLIHNHRSTAIDFICQIKNIIFQINMKLFFLLLIKSGISTIPMFGILQKWKKNAVHTTRTRYVRAEYW